MKLVINIDSSGFIGSKISLSTYNFNESKQTCFNSLIIKSNNIEQGQQWYAGDHSALAFQGIPCIAVTSSNLFEEGLNLTHTPNDTIENVDFALLKEASTFLTKLIKVYKE